MLKVHNGWSLAGAVIFGFLFVDYLTAKNSPSLTTSLLGFGKTVVGGLTVKQG